jgi:TRAP transporter 4TM/12TM fusion protein
LGNILPIIVLVFIGYALLGYLIPGMFHTIRFSIDRIAPYLYTAYEGMFGQTLAVSALFIYLFVAFGTALDLTGAGEFFVDLAYSIAGRAKGGPAQAAVYSSMLLGTINGSGAANVVTTGTFTIPLMKKVGFKPEFAGAVEAVASSGGQIMPPVMGAAAFLMSEMTGIAYAKIAFAALLPAALYYLTLSFAVYLTSHKLNLPTVDKDTQLRPMAVIKKGWYHILPLALLIGMMIRGYSVQRSAFFSILLVFAIGFLTNRKKMTLGNIYKSLRSSVDGIAPIAAACLLAGAIMGVINLTGLGLKISSIIETLAAGRMLVALVLTMLASLLLGMGLPTSACYMIMAVLIAPALTKMGASPMAAHLFILYFGALSTITPPVALSTFAAAGIAQASVWKTGVESIKLASTGFIIPFLFVLNPELLFKGTIPNVLFALVTSIIGSLILAISITGWMKEKISLVGRILLVPAGIMLFIVKPYIFNLIGIALTAAVLFVEIKLMRGSTRQREQ